MARFASDSNLISAPRMFDWLRFATSHALIEIMRTITITTYPSLPGRYRVEHTGEGRAFGRDTKDTGEAAAVALNYANSKSSAYVIVGHSEALAQIPAELRFKS